MEQKAKKTSCLPRYKQVINTQKKIIAQLMDALGWDEYNYNEHEFNYGIEMLKNYWETMENPITSYFQHIFLQQQKHGYWSFWINLKRSADISFWEKYRHIYAIYYSEDDHDFAQKLLHREYHLHSRKVIEASNTHHRMYHFLLNQPNLKV